MNVYFDKTLIIDEYVSFLTPLLGVPSFSIWGEDSEQIHARYTHGHKLLSRSSESACDYFVYPKYFRLNHFYELRRYAKSAKQYGKKVIVFSYGELDEYIDVADNIIWFKRSTKQSTPSNEHCLPPFPGDLLKSMGKINFIDEHKQGKISIGYTGYANYSGFFSWIRYSFVRVIGIISRIPLVRKVLGISKNEFFYGRLVNAGIGNYCRGRALHYLKKLSTYTLHFVQRKHALTLYTQKHLRDEYIQNMQKNDIALVVRGFGNYSFRLYEAVSLGKIPLYIDTGAKLPFGDEIPYHDLFIIVPFDDVKNIGRYIDQFMLAHAGKLPEVQQHIRDMYEQHFVMPNYYEKIIKLLESKIV